MKINIPKLLLSTALLPLLLLNLTANLSLAQESIDTQRPRYFVDESIFSSKEKLAIQEIILNAEKISQNRLLELTINLSATYDNPFDPDDIDVTAQFISPAGKKVVIPGFFYQGYTRDQAGNTERLRVQGESYWKVRFATRQTGEWKCYVSVQNRSGRIKSKVYNFQVVKSTNPGFIRRTKNNSYLEFETSKPFFAVGESIGWARRNQQTYDYDYYFNKLSENKCNYSRIWMVPWHLALEWTNEGWPKGRFFGIGKYCLENAWRLDYILKLAEEKSIYIMLTMGNYGDLMQEKGYWNEQLWSSNPYNIANGGPCKTPWDFFSNKQAKNSYKKRLRYIIARWGYSSNILAFELFNEVDAPLEWVREIAKHIKENDPFGHLVTISFGYPDWSKKHPQEEETWQLPEIDYTQLHIWGQGKPQDLVGEVIKRVREQIHKYKKPCLVAEFGIDNLKDDRFYDKDGKGINLHNGLWAAAMSGSFAGAVNWWWDSYIEPNNLYYQYKALANFAESIDWSNRWEVAKVNLIQKELADKVRILGLTNSDETIIWIQNKQSDCYANYQGIEPKSLEGISFNLLGMSDGQYKLQWWDTWEGKIINETEGISINGVLSVEMPNFKRDIAIKLRRRFRG